MKKSLKYWFTMLLILLAVSFLVISCKAKPQPQNTHTIEKTIETKLDSVSTIKISKAIQDSLILKISQIKTAKPECDSITNAEIKHVLQRLNNVKKSGNNEFGIFFDELKNELVIYADIKEAIEKDTKILKSLISDLKNSKSETIVKEVYPKWLVWLAIVGGLSIAYILYRFSKIFRP